MNVGFVLDMFVDRDGGVDDVGNNSFAFDNGLDIVVYVVVNMLPNDHIKVVGSLDR